ncbi:MAG: 3-dehydroquinate synthase [Alphaproteobacteria bacterium]|nr:3-dehydroquinate synthase [Alphaproteobacteria bacterium]
MTASAPTTIRVALGERSYDVVIGEGLFDQAAALARPVLGRPMVFQVTDEHVAALHADRLDAALARGGITTARRIVVPAGEASKSFDQLGRLLDALIEAGCERNDTIVALGGGVIGDLAGFAAAIMRRGVAYIQVPTTLLAQVDSSVGGKTAVDSPRGKNLIGAFHQPRLVLADIDTLATLPARELRAGYAEVVKYGLLGDAAFFAWLESNGADALAGDTAARRHMVATSCGAKARIVAADERETGKRALLNLGHTFGHALETAAGHGDALPHGEAVAIGMVLAFTLSARLGLAPAEDAARVVRHLTAAGLPTTMAGAARDGWTGQRLAAIIAQDKKVRDGRPTLVLARGIGRAFLSRDVSLERIAVFLDDELAAVRTADTRP